MAGNITFAQCLTLSYLSRYCVYPPGADIDRGDDKAGFLLVLEGQLDIKFRKCVLYRLHPGQWVRDYSDASIREKRSSARRGSLSAVVASTTNCALLRCSPTVATEFYRPWTDMFRAEIATLRSVLLFRNLSKSRAIQLLDSIEYRTFRHGEVVQRKGERTKSLLLVRKGKCIVLSSTLSATKKNLAIVKPGQFVNAEIVLAENDESNVSAAKYFVIASGSCTSLWNIPLKLCNDDFLGQAGLLDTLRTQMRTKLSWRAKIAKQRDSVAKNRRRRAFMRKKMGIVSTSSIAARKTKTMQLTSRRTSRSATTPTSSSFSPTSSDDSLPPSSSPSMVIAAVQRRILPQTRGEQNVKDDDRISFIRNIPSSQRSSKGRKRETREEGLEAASASRPNTTKKKMSVRWKKKVLSTAKDLNFVRDLEMNEPRSSSEAIKLLRMIAQKKRQEKEALSIYDQLGADSTSFRHGLEIIRATTRSCPLDFAAPDTGRLFLGSKEVLPCRKVHTAPARDRATSTKKKVFLTLNLRKRLAQSSKRCIDDTSALRRAWEGTQYRGCGVAVVVGLTPEYRA
eukprot:g1679.t1